VAGGTDTVYASVNYALQAGQEVEYLRANAGATGLALTGNEFNNVIVGLTGNDVLNGGLGNDTLNGGDGNDTLNGSAGNDALSGGNGNDLLIGGVGADTIAGGAGTDAFRWTAPTEGGDNVTDFKLLGTDVLQFNAAAFGFAPLHVLVNGTEFIANNAPVSNHAGPTFLMETDVHNLYFDADGTGVGAAVWIAHMNANAVASDFHLV
jgi:Ca2+-binding RTX toxin-like protein